MNRLFALVTVAVAVFGLALVVSDRSAPAAPHAPLPHPEPLSPRGERGRGEGEGKGGKKGLILNVSDKTFKGYTLFGPINTKNNYLIDMEGRVVKTWVGAGTPSSLAYLFPNGNLLRPCVGGNGKAKGIVNGAGGLIQEFDWDGKIVWEYKFDVDKIVPHHEVIKLPNGNVLAIASVFKSKEETAAAGRKGGVEVQADCLFEIRPTGKDSGEIVWEWHCWDHLIQDADSAKPFHGNVADHPELIDLNFSTGGFIPTSAKDAATGDWTHFNGVAYNAHLDQLMLSVHGFSEIWVIDHSTSKAEAAGHTGGKHGKGGDLIYRWGNPAAYRTGAEKDRQLYSQHNAHWIPKGLPGAGNILLFNNGLKRPGGEYSTIEELVLPANDKGQYAFTKGAAFGPEKTVWTYSAENKKDFYSMLISGVQRLPNGNTLICSGLDGTIFEVTKDKEVVWKYVNSEAGPGTGGVSAAVFRAHRIAPDDPALKGRDLKPGKPLEAK